MEPTRSMREQRSGWAAALPHLVQAASVAAVGSPQPVRVVQELAQVQVRVRVLVPAQRVEA